MPTPPHLHRPAAESFGVDVARYDRTRPAYPDALIARIVASSPGAAVLDVGCGTGILARQFVGGPVLGVEPDPRMAAFARATGVTVEEARFEEWDPAGRRFDTLVSGQAWHWVDPVVGAERAAAVLHPGGVLALFWHVFQAPATVGTAFADAYERVVPDSPIDVRGSAPDPRDLYRPILDRAAAGLVATGAFEGFDEWRHEVTRTYTTAQWLDLLPTQGTLTRLPADAIAEISTEVGAAIDALGGRFTLPFRTVALAARRS
ncbi:class I SAM-dependent methyltransferase [Cryptosporangium arvum]|uniref:class I SAM-dependent methyltransferase n=1 Tax=Cryptosporangium arvum TaxID=80871 RepID=UPI0004AF0B69|nr:class I SAM-dependent methyltransferase [Cryptosporangium arvum]